MGFMDFHGISTWYPVQRSRDDRKQQARTAGRAEILRNTAQERTRLRIASEKEEPMRRMMHWRIGLLWATGMAVGLPAGAAPIYTAEGIAVGGAGYAYEQKSSGTAIADTGYVFNTPALNAYARGLGIASQYGVGAAAELSVFWFGSAAQSEGRGRVDTEVVFSGPVTGDPIPVSVNLHVDGGFGGGYNAEQSSLREIILSVALYNGNTFGRVGERVNGGVPTPILEGPLAPAGLACLTASGCLVESPVFYVPANVPVAFSMQLLARVEAGFGVAQASFENTFYFPLGQDVFNLPDGYTADMPGLSVFNNRAVVPGGGGGGEVPEPATYALVGAGLAAAALRRRMRG
jgi:hypothetical protein